MAHKIQISLTFPSCSVAAMVLHDYDNMEDVYEEVKQAACGRQACSVMLLVATEVKRLLCLTALFFSLLFRLTLWPLQEF